ncbi:hypothetical protein QJS10_CPB20g00815 [Acorus calamus]|uniref:Transposase MuDR plant domain-containing protein n=1 Tax=Acorus calamus TaxID=4465 RepID=A0AAV9C9B2_ACOCL|nr:hypothetical protein QJS10_CPB20g00815 [Acorus calamus]
MDDLYRVTFLYGGYWKPVKSRNGQNYVEEVKTDAQLLDIFKENEMIHKFSLYVISSDKTADEVVEAVERSKTVKQSDVVDLHIHEEEVVEAMERSAEEEAQRVAQEESERPASAKGAVDTVDEEGTAEIESGAKLPVELSNEEYSCGTLYPMLINYLKMMVMIFKLVKISLASPNIMRRSWRVGRSRLSDEELGGEENTHEELEYGKKEPTVHEQMEYSCSDSDMSVGDYGGTVLHYDPELPVMEVGSQFSNVDEFRSALRQHGILHEFGAKYIKNDKFRVTAKCQGVDCPWRIHASVIQDNVTFEVKTLMSDHSCTSVNKMERQACTKSFQTCSANL